PAFPPCWGRRRPLPGRRSSAPAFSAPGPASWPEQPCSRARSLPPSAATSGPRRSSSPPFSGASPGFCWVWVGAAPLVLGVGSARLRLRLTRQPQGSWIWWGAAALALAGRLRPIGRWLPAPGLAALLVLGLGWYALASMRNPGFLWYTVVDNHLLNAVQLRRFPDEDVSLSSLEFLLVAGLGALPW